MDEKRDERPNDLVDDLERILLFAHAVVKSDEAWKFVVPYVFKEGAPLDEIREPLHTAIDEIGSLLQAVNRMREMEERGLSGLAGVIGMTVAAAGGAPDEPDEPGAADVPDILRRLFGDGDDGDGEARRPAA